MDLARPRGAHLSDTNDFNALRRGTPRAEHASPMKRFVALGLLVSAVGACSSSTEPSNECSASASDALRTCAAGPTLKGIDVSYYQGTVGWSQVKASGRTFAFARVSDGLNYPDSKFAQNWPAMKKAGLVRGVYQYFRPSQDPEDQAALLLNKVKAAGGLQAGDLPPVLDLETDSDLPAATVVARAKAWLAYVTPKVGAKPIIYTAAFMSSVIGNNFGGYTLWVANYGATCPLMPSGWTDWKFWQDSQTGTVPGIAGAVDTNFFNGALTSLNALTIKAAPQPNPTPTPEVPTPDEDPELVVDGSQGATLGSGNPADPASTPVNPCP